MLRFILVFTGVWTRDSIISIHPMLRFIPRDSCRKKSVKNFNTSHVTVYRTHPVDIIPHFQHFNTSHVTVYHLKMQLLSLKKGDFNTSHVTVYQIVRWRMLRKIQNFNTSHVTVYRKNETIGFITFVYFNTSHVTVYLRYVFPRFQSYLISIHPMLRFIWMHGYLFFLQ